MYHELKTWPVYFEAIWEKRKSFEIRKNDRGFQAGDTVLLREYRPEDRHYTGREVSARIAYVCSFDQKDGNCVFGLTDVRTNDVGEGPPASVGPEETVSSILKTYLTEHGFDGLYSEGRCGCRVDDICGDCIYCSPGVLKPCPEDCGDHGWHIGPKG
jgi:hypothetical protein